MEKLYKILLGALLFGLLNKSHAGELPTGKLEPIDFGGPYQTVVQKPGKKDILRKQLAASIASFPDAIINIVASYFFYKKNENITLYIDKASEHITHPNTSYSLPIIHVDPSHIKGDELLASVQLTTKIPRTVFKLQEWAYQRDLDGEEDRYAGGHVVKAETTYPVTEFDRYTFGIAIPSDNEWSARENLVPCDTFTAGLEKAFNQKQGNHKKHKIGRSCIIA